MEFGEPDRYTAARPCFSPDGRHILYAQDRRVLVREAESQALVSLFLIAGEATLVAWSPDSDHFLVLMRSGQVSVQVFSLSDPSWGCSIAEGAAGCVMARWAPSGTHVLLTADFCARLSVWSLQTRECTFLPGPKHPDKGLAFHPDGGTVAVLQRSACKDVLTVYSTETWEPVASWMPETLDAADLAWSPSGESLAVWEGVAARHALLLYGPDGGEPQAEVEVTGGLGLAVRELAWSPSGQLLAWGDWAGVVRLGGALATFTDIAAFQHPDRVVAAEGAAAPVVYREEALERLAAFDAQRENVPPANGREVAPPEARSRFVLQALPVSLATASRGAPVSARGDPASQAIDGLWWSHDGHHLATRVAGKPHVLWIWSTTKLCLVSLLVLQHPVTDLCWDPQSTRLIACSGQAKVYTWTPEGASCAHIPVPKLRPAHLAWNPMHPCLLLTGKESLACAYLSEA